MKKTILILAVLLAVAFSVRLVIAFNTYIISSDGPFYLSVARDFANGDYSAALNKQVFHQLLPFLIAVASRFISNPEWAGMLASIIISSLGIVPLYFIARKYFSAARSGEPRPASAGRDSIAIMACLLYCFHPQGAQLSAAIFTTGTHISILLFSLWVAILALETGVNLYFILSGILAFVMYLNRPDGLAFLGITLMGIMFLPGISWKAKGIKAIYLFVPCLLLLLPYLAAVESVTGVFGLTGKVSAEAVTDMEMNKSFEGIYQFVVEFIKGANPILFLLFLIGAIRAKPGNLTGRPLFVWMVFAGFMAFFAVYAFTHGRMSKRYTVPLFLMMLPWASAGIYYLAEKISGSHARKAGYGVIIILLLVLSVFTFKPVGRDKVIEKTTGELLKKYHSARSDAVNQSPVIITTLSRVAYYAGGMNIAPEGWDKDKLKTGDFLRALKDAIMQKGALPAGRQVDYLVLDGRITRRFPDLENELSKHFADNVGVELISRSFDSPETGNKYYKVYRFISRGAPQKNK